MELASFMQNALHEISQAMLSPTMAILVALVAYAVWCIGSIATEVVTDRRRYRADMGDALEDVSDARWEDLPSIIRTCGLLRRQKELLLDLVYHGKLGPDERMAKARMLMADAEAHYSRIITRMELVAKISPMLGLMGTLIPLGPGITAMNEGDLATLSTSLNIAFDTTVVGLITAVVALVVVRFRRHWYEDYLVRMDALFTAILAKAARRFDAPSGTVAPAAGANDAPVAGVKPSANATPASSASPGPAAVASAGRALPW